jgi:ABC-type lipopolysaccharide export system ATPase subunit
MRKMRSLGIGIVYIGHRLDEIFEVADRVTILKDGKLVGTHPIGSLTRDSMINPMVGRRLEQIFPPRPATPTQGPVVLAVDRLTAVDRVKDVSLSVREGEIVAIAGMVGSGRTEVAEAVFGARAIDSGATSIDGEAIPRRGPRQSIGRGVGFLTEDRKDKGLFLGLSVASNIVAPALGEITRNGLLDRSKESEARVKEIETDASGLASALVYVDANGRDRRQRAKVIILCANGVGTPRLLLMLGGSRYPDGLANSSGLVGKRLMMHPFASILASYEDPLDSWRGPFGQQVYSLEFYETDERRGFVRGSKWNCMPSGGPVGVSGAMGSKVYVAGRGAFRISGARTCTL